MKSLILSVLIFGALVFGTSKLPSEDLPGSSDHPLLGRPEGAVIVGYDVKRFDVVKFPLSIKNSKVKEVKEAEGKVYRIYYKMPGDTSPVAILRTYEKHLQEKGLRTVFKCSPCGRFDAILFSEIMDKAGETKWHSLSPKELSFILMEGNYGDKNLTVGIYTYSLYSLTHTRVRVVEKQPLSLKLEVLKAEDIKAKIAEKGSVSIYGIYFDHDSYTIKPESEETFREIARFLKENPEVKLYVVGHTDNTGSYDYNLELSKKRAEAVVEKLVREYGISANRLRAVGVGPVSPVAPNATEEGRAKNRRVELVLQ